MCAPLIGHIFALGTEPPLPAHPECYCFLTPVWKKPTDWKWEEMNEDGRKRWVRHAAWRLRDDLFYPPFLEPLREEAEEYNRNREEEDEHDKELPMPNDIVSAENTPHTLRIARAGRVLLQPTDASTRSGRREYECVFMQPGRVKQANQEPSNWLIPANSIRTAAHLFSGVPSNLDHPEMFGFRWGQDPQVRNLAGVTFDAHWSDTENILLGNIRLYDQRPNSPGAIVGALMDQILADKTAGLEVPCTGLSAVVFHHTTFDEEEGLQITTEITYAESVDFVYDAGAHGYVRAALSAAGLNEPYRRVWTFPTGEHIIGGNTPPQTHGGNEMPSEALQPNDGGTQQIQPPESIPPDQVLAGLQAITARLDAMDTRAAELAAEHDTTTFPPPPSETPTPDPVETRLNTLSEAVEQLAASMASQEEPGTIQGMGQPQTLHPLPSGLDQMQSAWDWVFGVPDAATPPPSLRRTDELYRLLSGDTEWSGVYQPDRVAFATANATTLADMTVNAMNKVIVPLYNRLAVYRWYEQIVSVQPTDGSLHDMAWLQFGGIGDLPVKEDGAAYTELNVADSKESDSFTVYGGYVGITEKALRNSAIAKLQAVPKALTISAVQTRSANIAAIFSSASGVGPTLDQDSVALFHTASHGNLATTAFSWNAWKAARIECAKQTEMGSDKRQGLFPRYGLFPVDLFDDALIQFGYGGGQGGRPGTGNQDVNPYQIDRPGDPRPIPLLVPDWTDTDNWAYIADPLLAPIIQMAYADNPGGGAHPAPGLYIVTSPLAGLMFTNDVLPVKIKDHYAYGVATYRGIGKRNVA